MLVCYISCRFDDCLYRYRYFWGGLLSILALTLYITLANVLSSLTYLWANTPISFLINAIKKIIEFPSSRNHGIWFSLEEFSY